MRFTFSALTIGLILAAPALAGEDGLTGYWKFSIYEQGQQISFWLVHLDKNKDNDLTASAEPLKGAPRVKLENVKQDGDTIKIKFIATIPGQSGQIFFDYEGKLPKPGAKKVYGSLTQGGSTVAAIMEATNAKTPFALDREMLQKTPTDPRALAAIVEVIDRAKDNKVEAKDLQAWVDGSIKTAEMYGPLLHAKHQLRILRELQNQKTYASVGLDTARKISKKIDPKAPFDVQLQFLAAVANVLRTSDVKDEAKNFTLETARRISKQIDAKTPLDTQLNVLSALTIALRKDDLKDEAAMYDARVDTLENHFYTEYTTGKSALNFKPEKFAGRKSKSNRAVLVELFTGAQCPPCIAADMAFDGLEKTYKAGEVVLLQYHLHIPGPEPMSNVDTDARFDYYLDAYPNKVRGTPTHLFNGKLAATGGGDREDAPDKYKEFCDVVNKVLETPDTLKLSASAVSTGAKIAITAKVASLDKPGDKMRLRLALVEDWVRFKGGNGLQYHHRVVRAMPGGVKGVGFKEKDFEHKADIDLDKLRASLNKYLDEDYPEGPRPMRLRNLSVVAFVQNDESAEVLQAINVPVRQE